MKFAKTFTLLAGSIAMVLGTGTGAMAKTDLLVYTAVEADELKGFKNAFEADYPDINIKWVRDSTGIITSKLLAEKANPKADIVWGLAATSLMLLGNEGYFQGYAPKGLKKLDSKYYDTKNNPPQWVGQRAWIASICYNTVEAGKHKLPLPLSWADLTKPVYKGHVIMPNPNSSGTGFLDVSSWMQMQGEEAAWKYMDALHVNIARYTHSGSKPCKLAAKGEIPIGVSFAWGGAKAKNKGAPVEVIAPVEGVGWDLEAFGIVKNTKHLKAARAFADWSVTKKANVIYNISYAVVAMPGVAKPVKNFPPGIADKMIKNDFAWAAANRIRILDEWRKRYDGKSEPKK
ncbi:MAG: putative 2-aminoethylphosphonate ABC transporter substrate-binding protein [Rhodospirillaceae bacterium]|jgi:iron(III) transport system substrate-binding protein|nr:putative 2-aminoethylphosphonate ABC transporter substrate-binding protein [Rhodospirillaceae bacterium]